MFEEHSAILAIDAGDVTGKRKLGGGRKEGRCGASASSKWAAKLGLEIAARSSELVQHQRLIQHSRPVRLASPRPGGFGPSSSNLLANLSI